MRGKSRDPKRSRHPDIGVHNLTYEAFDIRSGPGLQLIVHHAEQGSPSARALGFLGALAANPVSNRNPGQ